MRAQRPDDLQPIRIREHACEWRHLAQIITAFAFGECDLRDSSRALVDRVFPGLHPAAGKLCSRTALQELQVLANEALIRGPVTFEERQRSTMKQKTQFCLSGPHHSSHSPSLDGGAEIHTPHFHQPPKPENPASQGKSLRDGTDCLAPYEATTCALLHARSAHWCGLGRLLMRDRLRCGSVGCWRIRRGRLSFKLTNDGREPLLLLVQLGFP